MYDTPYPTYFTYEQHFMIIFLYFPTIETQTVMIFNREEMIVFDWKHGILFKAGYEGHLSIEHISSPA